MLRRLIPFALAISVAAVAVAPQRAYAGEAYAEEVTKEYLVKAAFIYNFVKFVEWPGDKAISKQSNIDICVLGDGPMMETGSVFKSASTPKLALKLMLETSAKAAASHCHVVFISKGGQVEGALAAFKGQPVLTVSDSDGFIEKGGMIGFVPSDNKVKVEVNTKPVTSAGMRVDAQLLEIAKRVIEK